MTRTAILTALLAAVPLLCIGDEPRSNAGSQVSAQQQQPPGNDKKSDTTTSGAPATEKHDAAPSQISPLIPVGAVSPPAADTTDPQKLAAASAVGVAGAKPAGGMGIDTKTYEIGAEDVLAIIVFEDKEFSIPQGEMVRPDGKITLPLLGEFQAAGKTPEQLQKDVADRLLKEYMQIPPHVSVVVMQVNSKHYFINGEVNRPGKFVLVVPTTVMQALVEAGGFRDFANKKKIRIQHADGSTDLFNYNQVEKGKNLKQNIYLKPGDAIYVD